MKSRRTIYQQDGGFWLASEGNPEREKDKTQSMLVKVDAKGFVLDKVESFAIDAAGDAYVITDNDGVDDHSGETQFLGLGKLNLPM